MSSFENILIEANDEDWIRIWVNRQTLLTQGHWFNDNIICYWDYDQPVIYQILKSTAFKPYRTFDIYL